MFKLQTIPKLPAVDPELADPELPAPELPAPVVVYEGQVRPVLIGGVWECSDVRLTDPLGDLYEVVDISAAIARTVSPVEFKLLFTAPERIAIKAARATDAVVADFYEIVDDPRLTLVDLGLGSTQQAIGYLQATGLLTAERAAQILAGTPQ